MDTRFLSNMFKAAFKYIYLRCVHPNLPPDGNFQISFNVSVMSVNIPVTITLNFSEQIAQIQQWVMSIETV